MSPTSRARAAAIAVSTAFAALAGWLYVLGDERGGSLPLFLAWTAVHVLYGGASRTFWALPIAATCPPLFAAAGSASGIDAAFVGLFYGVPFTFAGIVARRLWDARRPSALPAEPGGEDSAA